MKHIERAADAAFCILALPAMAALFPVERWYHNFPGYVATAGAWLYCVYALNRLAVVPLLTAGGRRRMAGLALALLTVAATWLLAAVELYTPKPSEHDAGIVRVLPVVSQYRQALWTLFALVEAASMAVGLLSLTLRRSRAATTPATTMPPAPEPVAAEQKPPEPPAEAITLRVEHRSVVVALADITHVEAMDNYVKVHRQGRPMVVSQITMKQVEAMLPAEAFMRVHRSHIVAVSAIESFANMKLRLHGGEAIPVGRTYAGALARLRPTP